MTIKHTLPSHPFALPLRELFGELRSYLAQDVSWFHFWGKLCLHLKYLTVAERLIVRDYLQDIVGEKWPPPLYCGSSGEDPRASNRTALA